MNVFSAKSDGIKILTWWFSSLVKSSLNIIHLRWHVIVFCKEAKRKQFTIYDYQEIFALQTPKTSQSKGFTIYHLFECLDGSKVYGIGNHFSEPLLCCRLEGKLHLPRLGQLPLGWHRNRLLLSFWSDSADSEYNPEEDSSPRNKKHGIFIYQLHTARMCA